eukprot:117128_1
MLAYQTVRRTQKAGIYCNYNDNGFDWKDVHSLSDIWKYIMHRTIFYFDGYALCQKPRQLKGIIQLLLDPRNNGVDADKYRNESQQYMTSWLYPLASRYTQVLMEWMNPHLKRYGIGYMGPPSEYNSHSALNTSHLVGWLTNTYTRWIGFNHRDNHTLMDALFADYRSLISKDLINAQRLLLQYDYVLPYGSEFKPGSEIWMYHLSELQRIFMQIKSVQRFNEMMHKTKDIKLVMHQMQWQHSNINPNEISTGSLRELFSNTGELELLIRHNQMDIELYQFSQMIAYLDIQFYKMINQTLLPQ